jgi:hypothetical protein
MQISEKITTINENLHIAMFDNGFLLETSGKNSDNEYASTKIIVSTVDDLVTLVREAASMTRTS